MVDKDRTKAGVVRDAEEDAAGPRAGEAVKAEASEVLAFHPFLAGLAPVVVVAGHYGVGKTNLALNMAVDFAQAGYRTTLVDLDVVNPYFRTSDYAEPLRELGVDVVSPVFAGTTVDSPGLSGRVSTVVQEAYGEPSLRRVVVDAGGDDVGATALGRFSATVQAGFYDMLYVVNERRNLTQDPGEAVAILEEIQDKARLQASGVVDNTHLQRETSEEIVLASVPFATAVAQAAGVPLLTVTVPRTLDSAFGAPAWQEALAQTRHGAYPVDMRVRTPWDRA